MLYKDFEAEMLQHVQNLCSRYVGKEFDCCEGHGFITRWSNICAEIKAEIREIAQKHLKYCDVQLYLDYISCDFYITIPSNLAVDYHFKHKISAISFMKIRIVTDCQTNPVFKINSINTEIQRLPIRSEKVYSQIDIDHPYLKSYDNRKIKMKDDIDFLVEMFYKELKDEEEYRYFLYIRTITEKALSVYQRYISKLQFLSAGFFQEIPRLEHFFANFAGLVMGLDDQRSVQEKINILFSQKRIYSAKFEIFENGDKKEERYFSALPMSLIKYQYRNIKEHFYNVPHTPACGNALIRISITNTITSKYKTINDCFPY